MSAVHCLRCSKLFEQNTIYHWFCSLQCYNINDRVHGPGDADQKVLEATKAAHPDLDLGGGFFNEQILGR